MQEAVSGRRPLLLSQAVSGQGFGGWEWPTQPARKSYGRIKRPQLAIGTYQPICAAGLALPRKNACNFQITGTGGGRASPPICTFSICASPGAPVPYFAQLIYVAASGG